MQRGGLVRMQGGGSLGGWTGRRTWTDSRRARRLRRRFRRRQNRPAPSTGLPGFLQETVSFGEEKFGAAGALAALTADAADDIANAQAAVDFYKAYLPLAIQSGDPGAIMAVAGGITQWQSTLDGLKEATDAQNDLIQQQIAAQEGHTQAVNELKDQQKRNEDLIRTQGPALLAATLQWVNNGLGSPAAAGRQFPSSTGLGGLARA